jgi:epoxyqueuosine reductase
MKEVIRRRAMDLGFDDCRVTTAATPDSAAHFQHWLERQHHGEMGYLARNAAKRMDLQKVLPGAKNILTLATSYATNQPACSIEYSSLTPHSELRTPHLGVVARYACYDDYHEILGTRLKQLTEFLSELGGGGTRSLWYVDTGPLLERDLAQRSGLGFIGKHTNLISRRLGNWIFLSEIITTLELRPDEPEKNLCGCCTRCISSCPTNAITAPFQLDARRCISYLTIELKGPIPLELRPAIGNRIYGCDDCLTACPWNRFAREGQLMRAHARPELATPDLLELLSMDDAEFKRRFAGTPMLRAKRRGLLRNVCVALGNIGDAAALPALEKAAADAEPLISEHACWAIEQIKRIGHLAEVRC